MKIKNTLAILFLVATLPQMALADPYRVTIYTQDTKRAGTDSSVFIQLYGKNGHTHKVILDPVGNSFERAHWDSDILSLRDLGALSSIRLGHDNSGKGPGWLPKTIYITNLKTGKRTDFGAGQWIGGKKDPKARRFVASNTHIYKKSELNREVQATRVAMARQKKASKTKKKSSSWSFSDALNYVERGAKIVGVVAAGTVAAGPVVGIAAGTAYALED